MSCRRSLEIELPEFLAEPGAAAFDGFRDHYPRCAECAAEVCAWTELDAQLAAGGGGAGGAHPESEQLARYEALPAGERAGLDHHLAGCPSCREELRQLRAFSPERLAEQVRAPLREGRGRTRRALGSLGRLVWHPAFAYAIAGLLLFPALWWNLESTPMRIASAPARDDDAGGLFAAAKPAVRELARARSSTPGQAVRSESVVMEMDAVDEDEAAESFAVRSKLAAEESKSEAQYRVVAKASRARNVPAGAFAGADAPAEAKLERLHVEAEPRIARLEDRRRLDEVVAQRRDPAGELAVRLSPGATIEVEVPADVGFLRLLIPVPADQSDAAVAGLRLASADGRREMRERAALPAASPPRAAGAVLLAAEQAASAPQAAATEIEWRVPRGWLVPGVYRVELTRPGDRPDDERVVGLFFLVVRTP